MTGSDEKNGDLCSHCRAAIYRDLADDGLENPEYEHTEITNLPVQTEKDSHNTENIHSNGYYYEFFDNF